MTFDNQQNVNSKYDDSRFEEILLFIASLSVDIDECKDGTHQCRYNQICENMRGSYRCACPRGYRSQGVGRPCIGKLTKTHPE